jgi:hypothetical protein
VNSKRKERLKFPQIRKSVKRVNLNPNLHFFFLRQPTSPSLQACTMEAPPVEEQGSRPSTAAEKSETPASLPGSWTSLGLF